MKSLTIIGCWAVTSLFPLTALAQTQGEMNHLAREDFAEADKELNKVYQQLLSKIDKESQGKLKIAQRNWIAFRDSQADLFADFAARGGTMFPTLYQSERASITTTRTEELKKLLKEFEELGQ